MLKNHVSQLYCEVAVRVSEGHFEKQTKKLLERLNVLEQTQHVTNYADSILLTKRCCRK